MNKTDNRIKVCILQNGLARGGTDTFVVNLVKGLDKSIFDITVINPSHRPASEVREPEILAAGAKIERTSDLRAGFRSKLRHLRMLYSILKKGRFDVFHTNIDLFNGVNLLVAKMTDVKINVCHSHNSMQQKELVEGRTPAVRFYQYLMRWLCWHCSTHRTGCSPEAMDFLFGEKWKTDKNSQVVFNGIDLTQFSSTVDVATKKNALGLNDCHLVLTVGRKIPQKNPLFIVDVFATLCKLRDDVELVWVGSGCMDTEVDNYISEHGISHKIHMLGERDDVSDIMKCCDAFILPSHFEGLGIVAIEAQAAGLPCLVSDTVPRLSDCGLCEYMSLNEENGLWANRLSDILDGKHNLRINKEALYHFSTAHMVGQMESIYNS